MNRERAKEILAKFSDQKIAVIGDVGIDLYTQGDVERISPEAPVPVLGVSKEWKKLGLAANVAENLKTLGAAPTLIGLVGTDETAKELQLICDERSIDHLFIEDDSRTTTLKQRVMAGNQQICRVDYESSELISDDLSENLLSHIDTSLFDGFIIQDYGKGLFTPSNLKKIITKIKSVNKMIMVDPSVKKSIKDYYGCSLFKPNYKEAQSFSKELGSSKVELQGLREASGAEAVTMTKGAEGIYLLNSEFNERVETASIAVFDVSGAGDTTLSTLTSCLLSGANLKEAAQLANLASAIVVGKVGTATVTCDEILERL